MKVIWTGYTWSTPAASILPRVVSAQFGQRPAPGAASRRIVNKLWVLDYARSDCGLARVGSPRAPWRRRSAGVAHLYPPGTPYWEDTSDLRGPVREAWVIFAGGDEAGLRRLTGRGLRFARIADPSRLLEPLLREMARAGSAEGEAGFWPAQSALATVLALLGSLSTADIAHPHTKRHSGNEFLLAPPGDLAVSAAGAVGAGASSALRARGPAGDAFGALRESGVARPGEGGSANEGDAAQTADGLRGPSLVQAASDFFRPRLAERITLAAVARHLRMSASAFSHRYAAEAGRSPMAALTDMRIELARSLLLRGLKMETIARHVGFCDAFHFSKTFRKRCGRPPSAFRRDFWKRP